mmetsp:Transcript_11237/g.24717  ORF Transcript_11237/g.24717 Transcript_11237/m.24717 type:complete len:98 (+) Transcript_11237:212-505(+)
MLHESTLQLSIGYVNKRYNLGRYGIREATSGVIRETLPDSLSKGGPLRCLREIVLPLCLPRPPWWMAVERGIGAGYVTNTTQDDAAEHVWSSQLQYW